MSNDQYLAPAGWYPDPTNGGVPRYWDGSAWTDHFGPAEQPAGHHSMFRPAAAIRPPLTRGGPTFAQANHQSLISLGVSAVYLLLASTLHVVFLGIIPIMAGVRAHGRREPLAMVALVGAIAVAVLGVAAITGS